MRYNREIASLKGHGLLNFVTFFHKKRIDTTLAKKCHRRESLFFGREVSCTHVEQQRKEVIAEIILLFIHSQRNERLRHGFLLCEICNDGGVPDVMKV